MSLLQELKEFEVLQDFTEQEMRLLATFIDEKEYEDGQLIIDEKGQSSHLYFIFSGKVKIFRTLTRNTEILTTLGENDIFGEVAFADQQPRSASVSSIGKTQVGAFAYEHFEVIKKQDAVFGMKLLMQLLKVLAKKFRMVNQSLDGLLKQAHS
jgi:CRP-like cAMP-binding protein